MILSRFVGSKPLGEGNLHLIINLVSIGERVSGAFSILLRRLGDRGDPTPEIVIIGDTGNLAIPNLEEGPGRKDIALTGGFGHTLIGCQILAVNDELRSSTCTS